MRIEKAPARQLKRGGLRLYHPTLRDCVLVIRYPAKTPQGTDRDRQFVIDADGYCLVSEGVWNGLERERANNGAEHGFIVTNVVAEPPPMRVGDGVQSHRRTHRLERSALREIAPAGVATRVITHPINVRSQ